MIKNVGSLDRMFRIVIGVGLLGIAIFDHQAWGWIGLILVATGFLNYCPIYTALGKNTATSAPAKDETKKDSDAS